MSLIPLIGGPSWTTFWMTLGTVVLVGGPLVFERGCSYEQDKAKAKLFEQSEKAREIEANWQINLEAQNELDVEERVHMAADYDLGLRRLRNRAPVRMPASAASACAGASPAQLAAPDAERFERIGRDARAVQLDLEKARAWIETVTK